ncbi:putative reverse transcriptase domain-containing protein, partial [Tanacetum coccineum]
FVMSDSEDFTVTYMEVSSPFEDLSNIGSPGFDGLPMMLEDPYVEAALQALPSPDYVPGPEYPPLLEFVPEPVYLEFMPPEDEVFPTEEQPLPAAVSPTTDSPGYIGDSNPEEDEEDHEEDTEEDPEEDPADYPTNGGDDDDDDDESSDDDEDDDVEEDEDKEEEEHLALADSVPPPVHRVTARMYVRAQTPISLPSDTEILSPPLPISPPPLLASLTYPLGYKAIMIRLRAETPSTFHPLPSSTLPLGTPPLLPISLPTPLPLLILPSTVCRAGVSEVTLPPQKRLCIALDDEIRREPKREVGYGITDTWDEMVEDTQGTPAATDVQSMDASDTARSKVRALQTTVLAQQTQIRELRAVGRRRQTHLIKALTLMRTLQTQPTKYYGITPGYHDSGMGVRRQAPPTRKCTYPDFMKCKPLYFKGTEGVVALTQWFERMETVFYLSNCSVENQIKFATCTLLGSALTLWNSHVKTVGHDVAYAITWINLKKKMNDKYCPRGEVKKLEGEMWNLKVKGTDVVGYNQRFQELAFMCDRMFLKESNKIEKYVSGLPDMIHGSVMASKPKTMQDAIEFATELIDKKIRTFAKRQSENKRKQDDNQQQQQHNKRHNTGRAYAAGSGEKKPYGGSIPLCSKCNYHHDGQCALKCHKS